jgi:epoxide hydrolase-like predicted phosphatase
VFNRPVKNIIFDFGGVIIPIDPMAYARGMIALGCKDISGLHERFMKEQVYARFEKGEMSPGEFRMMLRSGLENHATDEQLDGAWNLILGEIPPHRVNFIEKIKSKYRTFLLSNTNKIHYDHYQEQFCKTYGYDSLDNLFENAYYSFQLKLYKPDPAIFEYVLKDSSLDPAETLFIDDYLTNVEAAKQLGLQVIHLEEGMEVAEIKIPNSKFQIPKKLKLKN